MAEAENGQEKTEQPTPKRLRESREKGQIARSRELNTMAVTLVAAVGMWFMARDMFAGLTGVMEMAFQPSREQVFDTATVYRFIGRGLLAVLEITGPFLLLMTVVAILAPLALGGWSFSPQALAPKLERISPIQGMKRLFSARAGMELFKALAKFVIIGGVGVALFFHFDEQILMLGYEAPREAIVHGAKIFATVFVVLAASLALIAAVDVPFQIWDHTQKLKMTLQEVQDEMKETEGKPEVKQKVRQMQHEMTQRRMMEAVPEADVVITNPTHYAVALRYDTEGAGAPVVVAKGQDMVALQIRKIAQHNGVEIFENPPLARAIYNTTEIDQEIPADLYVAVAQVLAWIFQLKSARDSGEQAPPRPDPETEVPDELWREDDGGDGA